MAKLASHEIGVGRFEMKLIWPLFIQPIRRNDGVTCVCPELDPDQQSNFLDHWVQEISARSDGKWSEVGGTYPPKSGPESGPAYGEFCYFHPFVRNFLYVTRDDVRNEWKKPKSEGADRDKVIEGSRNRNLRILKREDLATLAVTYGMEPDAKTYSELTSAFDIDSCWLYLFDTRIALLELDLRYDTTTRTDEQKTDDLNLRMVLKLRDIVRRVYSPYWSVYPNKDSKHTCHSDGHVPVRVELKYKEEGANSVTSSFGNFEVDNEVISIADAKEALSSFSDDQIDEYDISDTDKMAVKSARDQRLNVFRHREPHVVEVWRTIMQPLIPVELRNPHEAFDQERMLPLQYEQIQDDRMALMSYIAVKNSDGKVKGVRQVEDGDWMRLAFVDDEGESKNWPYSERFYRGHALEGVAYDRYWNESAPAQGDDWFTTRWLCTDYSFTGVGDADNSFFFTDEHSGGLCHHRHHYFALTMIGMFHRASLLRYKHALAEYSDELLPKQEDDGFVTREERLQRFRARIEPLQLEIMRFRAMYWFSEVSNQIQGQELFAMLRRHLNLEEMFEDVCADIEKATAILQQRSAEQLQENNQKLTQIGLLFVMAAVPLLAMEPILHEEPLWTGFGALLIVFAILSAISSDTFVNILKSFIHVFGWRSRPEGRPMRSDQRPKWGTRVMKSVTIGVSLLGGAVLFGIGMYRGYEALSAKSAEEAISTSIETTDEVEGSEVVQQAEPPEAEVLEESETQEFDQAEQSLDVTDQEVPEEADDSDEASKEESSSSGSNESSERYPPQ